jgi:2-iminobutanoate/2-iminopropanoate deaminase
MKKLILLIFFVVGQFLVKGQETGMPQPVAPYSPSVMTNSGILFISGQIPINPKTKKLVKEDIKAATKQVMENIGVILKENNMNYSDIVKCTVFLTDIKDYSAVNEMYGSFFKDKFPAREAIQVVHLPLNASIEISAIASK